MSSTARPGLERRSLLAVLGPSPLASNFLCGKPLATGNAPHGQTDNCSGSSVGEAAQPHPPGPLAEDSDEHATRACTGAEGAAAGARHAAGSRLRRSGASTQALGRACAWLAAPRRGGGGRGEGVVKLWCMRWPFLKS